MILASTEHPLFPLVLPKRVRIWRDNDGRNGTMTVTQVTTWWPQRTYMGEHDGRNLVTTVMAVTTGP